MKRRLITLVLASATAVVSLGISTGVTAKADSFIDIYDGTYSFANDLQKVGAKYHITPRLKTNGSKMEDNKLEDVVAASEKMQNDINGVRGYLQMFPNEYWKAKNTFSEIADSYQQPIYEWIVEIAVNLNKEINEVEDSKTMSKEEVSNFINKAETQLRYANQLNKGVDEAYKEAYKVALINASAGIGVLKESLENGDKWIDKNNKWYYLHNDNTPVTGWTWITGSIYFFNKDGSMKTGWYSTEYKGKTYWSYLKQTGQRAEGWEKINNKCYYFDTEVGEMRTGWVGLEYNKSGELCDTTYDVPNGQAGFKFYYMNKSGEMVKGKHVIDGVSYTFDENGILVK